MTYAKNAPFRADVVGSYLRPAELKRARADFEAGRIDADALKAVEDRAITDLVAKQKAAGLHVITDGEFRRAYWHLDFMWGLQGVAKGTNPVAVEGSAGAEVLETAAVNGRIGGESHPFVEHFRFVKQFEDDNTVAKQTIPSPAQTLFLLQAGAKEQFDNPYANDDELADALVAAYAQVVRDLYDAGCRALQLDDCTWGMLVSAAFHDSVFGRDPKDVQRQYAAINNAVIDAAPEGMVVNTHICRGNYQSQWFSAGGYAPVADVLFGEERPHAYYLEFDDDRSGDFEPLAKVSGDKMVVLGLITSKKPELEDREAVKARIAEAAQYLPLERLCLSTQCGFASTEEGNNLTEEQQWAKIALVKSIADEVWGED
ncbi:5-methyltetrahydropteroyltriglutamate--homocysteine S-methyltransferase [Bifidobacterium avesanii]|uniref:5-methyltetrahydropteroyltriglutamate--homocysteine S-methyltransferase n=1 Tax=Bifidobacterium avesanii TaxID=1798157 RepID=A0A7K3THK6_9BIFI|nr:5-methyltetrahydropteroyltriglutamate--homocysteine S-methyltransferase [Bifidobacterium avesanii]KAB8287716.1 5-methyltetrahydropteroyltriglutamate-- homocyste ine methyltransferase [Bifidobacterium avesanii]NEG78174.1 5-methyltetrahydropteroyltriglutamate--homocysteine S-methyltransferase [Bifidobacterium avesanii]